MFFLLQKLSLENNKLTTLRNFPNLNLEVINLKGNKELTEEEVELLKNKCNSTVIFWRYFASFDGIDILFYTMIKALN